MKPIFLSGFISSLLLILSFPVNAQIAAECEGVEVPEDYDEDKQQAHLNNYFAAGFLMTPLAPIQAFQGEQKASIGLELGIVPPLGCQERLVLGGTKTEDTNKLPVNPRPRILAALPAPENVSLLAGFTLMPPVEIPDVGSILQAGVEMAVGVQISPALTVGTRAHLNFTRARAEIATPFIKGAQAYDDLFYASSLGMDLALSYSLQSMNLPWATPYFSAGVADITTLFIVGDDLVVTQNVDYPWWGALVAGGVQMIFADHFDVTVEVSSAAPIFSTAKLKLGYRW